MKVLTVDQIRALDAFTIANEPIAPHLLMERAANACVDWILEHFPGMRKAFVLCGSGNNGGDGLVIARQLAIAGWDVMVAYPGFTSQSPDFLRNLALAENISEIQILPLSKEDGLPKVDHEGLFIDALLGSGLNKSVEGVLASWIDAVNAAPLLVISIDIPSGIFADQATTGAAIQADFTLSFEVPKLAFLVPENQQYVGEWDILSIGLHPGHLSQIETPYHLISAEQISSLLRPRRKFDHKGVFGHALLITGSYGKAGAAILAGRAALRSGAGLVTLHVPGFLNPIVQGAIPEAMVVTDDHEQHFTRAGDLSAFTALGVGCGIGQAPETREALTALLNESISGLILDADALNLISADPKLLDTIPPGSILTPHLKEFERLFGKCETHFVRLERLRTAAMSGKIVIVLKGAHTAIGTPDGNVFFNTTGNPGMATAGSGDVLTGIITGLRAQGYNPVEAALAGVYLHGLAGDLATIGLGQEALTAGDIIDHLGSAFLITHIEISENSAT